MHFNLEDDALCGAYNGGLTEELAEVSCEECIKWLRESDELVDFVLSGDIEPVELAWSEP